MRNTLIRPEEKGTGKFYLVGFVLCIVLTLAAYFLVVEKLLTGMTLILVILGLGVIQMAVQLLFFMHLGGEYADGKAKHHWNFLVFFFMIMVLIVIVFGSLWIMYTLNYREMPSMNMSQPMEQNG
jgi:cytochrome o ubiquinol oxidase operon protein cyoD